MPGQNYQDPYEGLPICECNHVQGLHKDCCRECRAENCNCKKFKQIPFDDSEFGKAWNEFVENFNYDED